MPGFADADAFLTVYATALAAQPWLPHFAGAILDVQVHLEKNDRFFVTDISGKILPLSTSEKTGWSLIALGGGYPIHLFGEWNGRQLRPVSAVAGGRHVCY